MDAAADRREKETVALGVAGILAQDPIAVPKKTKKSPCPLFHAASREARDELRESYKEFVAEYWSAPGRFRAGQRDAIFPDGCFPPALPSLGDSPDSLLPPPEKVLPPRSPGGEPPPGPEGCVVLKMRTYWGPSAVGAVIRGSPERHVARA